MEVEKVLKDCLYGRLKRGQIINLINYLVNNKKSILKWQPITISAFPTYECNFSCDMCLTHSTRFKVAHGQRQCGNLSLDMLKDILNIFPNAIILNLVGNGEPLFNKDLFKMIDYAANEMKMYTFSSSNGLILGEFIDQIISSSLTGFNISLNGHNSEEFHRMTGMPSDVFNIIINNIKILTQQKNMMNPKLEISISIILDRYNYKYLLDMASFSNKLGVDKILFFQFLPNNTIGFRAKERCLFSDDLAVLETFNSIETLPKEIKNKISLPPLLSREGRYKSCSIPFVNISIDGSGDVGSCCCQLLNFRGNGKFSDINVWNNKHFIQMRRRFLDPECPLLEPCKSCYNNTEQSKLAANSNLVFYLIKKLIQQNSISI